MFLTTSKTTIAALVISIAPNVGMLLASGCKSNVKFFNEVSQQQLRSGSGAQKLNTFTWGSLLVRTLFSNDAELRFNIKLFCQVVSDVGTQVVSNERKQDTDWTQRQFCVGGAAVEMLKVFERVKTLNNIKSKQSQNSNNEHTYNQCCVPCSYSWFEATRLCPANI